MLNISAVVDLSKRCPHIGLTDSSSLDKLREEFMDFKLSPADLPCTEKYKSVDKTERPKAGNFWWELGKLKTLEGKARFPPLVKLMTSLLTFPVSNADSELSQETLIAQMAIKFNSLQG